MGREGGGAPIAASFVAEFIREASHSEAPALLIGEPGTQRETIARYIHRQGGHRGPFIPVRCRGDGAEEELFGTLEATPGAARLRPGALAEAHNGTLYLDEVEQLGLKAQARLSRFMNDRVFAASDAAAFSSQVRLIGSTSGDLPALVEQGLFRLDLATRLGEQSVRLKPTRERLGELPRILDALRRRCLQRELTRLYPPNRWPVFTNIAIKSALRQPWAGNLRELESAVLRSLFLATPRLQVGASALCIRSSERAKLLLEVGLARVLETSHQAEAERFLELSEWEHEEHRKHRAQGMSPAEWRRQETRPLGATYPVLSPPPPALAPAVACLMRLDQSSKKPRWPLLLREGQWHQFFPVAPVEISQVEPPTG